jgi:branched-chain amino acid transport system substrate-binding protein
MNPTPKETTMNKREWLKTMLASAALLAGGAQAQSGGDIKIGAVLSVTGPAAFLGEPELKTLQLYVERLNAGGGVLGRKLALVHYDDGSDAGKANGFTKRLLESDKVELVIGGTTTGATMAMAPLVEKAQVPFISLAGGVVVVEPVKKWVFKTPHTDRMAAEKVFADMKTPKIAKVGLLSETSGFGQSGRKETLAVAAKYGIEIVADETYGPKDADVTAQLTKIKAMPGVQAIFVFGLGQGPAVVAKNIAQLGIKLPHYQSHGVASDEFLKLTGPAAAEGIRLPSPSLLVADALPASDPQKSLVSGYIKAYKERFREEPSTFGGYAYDALMLSVDAIKRAGSVDGEKLRTAIEQTKGFVGVTGNFNLSATDHMGLDLSAFRMLEIKGGEWVLAK